SVPKFTSAVAALRTRLYASQIRSHCDVVDRYLPSGRLARVPESAPTVHAIKLSAGLEPFKTNIPVKSAVRFGNVWPRLNETCPLAAMVKVFCATDVPLLS